MNLFLLDNKDLAPKKSNINKIKFKHVMVKRPFTVIKIQTKNRKKVGQKLPESN